MFGAVTRRLTHSWLRFCMRNCSCAHVQKYIRDTSAVSPTSSCTWTSEDLLGSDVTAVLNLSAGHIQVSGESCQEILAAADMLQLLPVVTICRQFLIQQLAPDNCVGEMLH